MTAIQPCATVELRHQFGNKYVFRELYVNDWPLMGDAVVRHADYHEQFNIVLRANRAVVLALLWAALAACVISSLVYDVSNWISAW